MPDCLRARGGRVHQFQQQSGDFVAGGAHEETQIGGDLLVAAASGVQFERGLADDLLQVFFDEVVNVLGLFVVQKLQPGYGESLQPALHRRVFVRGKNTSREQGFRVRAAGCNLFLEETLIKGKRPLPALEFRIERLSEPPGPHLHFVTSTAFFFFAAGSAPGPAQAATES